MHMILTKLETEIILFVSLIIAMARPAFVTHTFNPHIFNTYMAIAHIWAMAMAGGWYLTGHPICRRVVLGLSLVEVICAIITVAIR